MSILLQVCQFTFKRVSLGYGSLSHSKRASSTLWGKAKLISKIVFSNLYSHQQRQLEMSNLLASLHYAGRRRVVLGHTLNILWHVITKISHNVLSKFTILCWATFITILGHMQPIGCGWESEPAMPLRRAHQQHTPQPEYTCWYAEQTCACVPPPPTKPTHTCLQGSLSYDQHIHA